MSVDKTRDTDQTAIRQLLEQWAKSVRAKDLKGILAHHSSDISMFDLPGPLELKGIDAYRKTWDLFFSWSDDPVIFDFDELRVEAGDDVAFATGLMRCAGTEKSGERIGLKFRLTVGLRKVDGQWIVMHEHHSIPAD